MTYEIVSERKVRYPTKINEPGAAFEVLKRYSKSKQEQFIVMTLTGAHEVVTVKIISLGILNRTLVHPREVFRKAIEDAAAAIIIAHNHPSGQLEASEEDKLITKRLQEAGDLIGIPVLDHIIFTRKGFISFKNEGLLI